MTVLWYCPGLVTWPPSVPSLSGSHGHWHWHGDQAGRHRDGDPATGKTRTVALCTGPSRSASGSLGLRGANADSDSERDLGPYPRRCTLKAPGLPVPMGLLYLRLSSHGPTAAAQATMLSVLNSAQMLVAALDDTAR